MTNATSSVTPRPIEASADGRFAIAASSTCVIAPANDAGRRERGRRCK